MKNHNQLILTREEKDKEKRLWRETVPKFRKAKHEEWLKKNGKQPAPAAKPAAPAAKPKPKPAAAAAAPKKRRGAPPPARKRKPAEKPKPEEKPKPAEKPDILKDTQESED